MGREIGNNSKKEKNNKKKSKSEKFDENIKAKKI